jgi:hypothetical protein
MGCSISAQPGYFKSYKKQSGGRIYDLALAERFGPLDSDALSYRELACMYGSSFWEAYPEQAVYYFGQVAAMRVERCIGWTARALPGRLDPICRPVGPGRRRCAAQIQYELSGDASVAATAIYAAEQCNPPTPTANASETETLTATFLPSKPLRPRQLPADSVRRQSRQSLPKPGPGSRASRPNPHAGDTSHLDGDSNHRSHHDGNTYRGLSPRFDGDDDCGAVSYARRGSYPMKPTTRGLLVRLSLIAMILGGAVVAGLLLFLVARQLTLSSYISTGGGSLFQPSPSTPAAPGESGQPAQGRAAHRSRRSNQP